MAVEDPSGPDPTELLRSNGVDPVPVTVDTEGIRCRELAQADCHAVLVTAVHQYPTGVALSPRRRRELVSWAREADATIIEDDYDAVYRYDRPAVAALQSMDPRRVVYIGSLSKTLSPAVRLGWMVIPPALRADLTRHKWLESRGCGVLEQVGFAEFLRNGGYDRHLRRTRILYRKRRDALLQALTRHLGNWWPAGIDAGLHIVLRLPPGLDDTEVAAKAAADGIRVVPLSNYAHRNPTPPALVFGFARLSTDQLDAAVAALAKTLQSMPQSRSEPDA